MGDNEATTYNLLFVCTGNTCRSPMAEAISRAALASRGWTHVQVASAGIAAGGGGGASAGALEAAREHGIDLSMHSSQQLTPEHIKWADLILAMSPSHVMGVVDLGGGEKVALVTDFLHGEEEGTPIEDPYGGDLESYRITYAQLERAIGALLERLEPILSP